MLHTTAVIYGLILEEICRSRLIILRRDSDRSPTLARVFLPSCWGMPGHHLRLGLLRLPHDRHLTDEG